LLAGPSVLLGLGHSTAWFDVILSLLMLAAILSLCFESHQRLFALLLGIPTIALSLVGITSSGALFLPQICEVAFFLGAAVLVVKSLFVTNQQSFDSALGAVCGYLFLGLGWAVCYSLIESFRPGSFALGERVAEFGTHPHQLPQELIYYSFVTLTTMGYGDFRPISPPARTLAWMEAVAGQFYLAVIVTGLVSMIVATAGNTNAATAASDDNDDGMPGN
jgi:voltage-gated potassium channel